MKYKHQPISGLAKARGDKTRTSTLGTLFILGSSSTELTEQQELKLNFFSPFNGSWPSVTQLKTHHRQALFALCNYPFSATTTTQIAWYYQQLLIEIEITFVV